MRNASFDNPQVTLEGRTLHIRATLGNQSPDPWIAREGWAAGFHLFDDLHAEFLKMLGKDMGSGRFFIQENCFAFGTLEKREVFD